MTEPEKGIIVTVVESSPGQVTLSVYERHGPEAPGITLRKDLDLFEMQRINEVLTKALWFHVRTLV